MTGVRGIGISLAEKWIETVAKTSRVSDRTIAMVLLRGNTVLVNSVYTRRFDLDEGHRDDLLDCVIVVAGSFRERLVNIITRGFKGHVEVNAEDYENQQGGNGFGVRNKEGERILEFYAALYMTVRNTIFKKRKSLLVFIVWSNKNTTTKLLFCYGSSKKV